MECSRRRWKDDRHQVCWRSKAEPIWVPVQASHMHTEALLSSLCANGRQSALPYCLREEPTPWTTCRCVWPSSKRCDYGMYRPIGRYRRSQHEKSLTSLHTTRRLLYVYLRLRMAHCLCRNWWEQGRCLEFVVAAAYQPLVLTFSLSPIAIDRPICHSISYGMWSDTFLHEAEDDAVNWLNSVATAALAK